MKTRDPSRGPMGNVVVTGLGLHGGAPVRVSLEPRVGPITIACGDVRNVIAAWRSTAAERSTAITCDGATIRTVEHLFSALAGLGIRDGIAIEVDGPELPILDGAAAEWVAAIDALGGKSSAPTLYVARFAEIVVGRSRYEFAPSDGRRVTARLELDDPRIASEATWDGDAADYLSRIAPARTFCFASELDELARRGLAAHVPPESVVVIGDELMSAGAPVAVDEPARHKLLDLIGDLYLYGGPPLGRLDAFRPGHAATHDAMRIAIESGVVRA